MNKVFEERRGFIRANFPCKITIFTPQEHELDSHTENIGAGGIRVVIKENLDLSSLVDLKIYLDKEIIKCKGRIVWVVEKSVLLPERTLVYDTGIEFYEIKEQDRSFINDFVRKISENKK